jgi:hypothetical protein
LARDQRIDEEIYNLYKELHREKEKSKLLSVKLQTIEEGWTKQNNLFNEEDSIQKIELESKCEKLKRELSKMRN